MRNNEPTDEQLWALYHRFNAEQAGTMIPLIRLVRDQRRFSLVHIRCLLGQGEADFGRLQHAQIPRSDHFAANVLDTLVRCRVSNLEAFADLLGGPLLLACLRHYQTSRQLDAVDQAKVAGSPE